MGLFLGGGCLAIPHSLLCQGRLPLNPLLSGAPGRVTWVVPFSAEMWPVASVVLGRVGGTGSERRWEGGGGQAGLRPGHTWLLSTSSSPSRSSFPSHPCLTGCSAVNGARLMQLAC